jgi:hypothetical protein
MYFAPPPHTTPLSLLKVLELLVILQVNKPTPLPLVTESDVLPRPNHCHPEPTGNKYFDIVFTSIT